MEQNNRNVRIKDIALKAGVSTGTVDRVLHNRGKVSEKAKAKILKIIEESNYEPNLMARALGSHKTYRIAALIPDHQVDSYWKAPKAGIEKAEKDLKQYGVVVEQFVFNPYQADSYIEKANELTRTRPDGILLSPIFYRETLPFFEKWGKDKIPFVLFNTEIAEFGPLSYIGQDSYQSGMLGGKLLHYGQPGPCSILIAHIDEEISNAAHLIKKENGMRSYFTENDPENHYKIIRVELNRSDQNAFVKKLDDIVDNTPDLKHIFVTTSKAYDIATYLEKKKISGVKIIGYDLLPKNLAYLNTGAISFLINQNPKGQGYWSVSQLVDFLVFKKDVQPLKFLPLDIVTKENLHYYIDEEDLVEESIK
ncbi:substrate-binding domain-containing protein [Dyadobacter diqingensis]|uniref:substrate-binding domain-containing protein n=1 Tax=Dyadobacter diqingensis TaxID=2938121 RepID=UPI0020C1AFBC|nr:substrate-binding domain-containing protein [Dyadobacter diqingensis]